MRRILGYVWERQYFEGNGDAQRGKKVFADKSCALCHNQPSSGAPSLAKGKATAEACNITSEQLIEFLGGLPRENTHCADLAVNTLRGALAKLG